MVSLLPRVILPPVSLQRPEITAVLPLALYTKLQIPIAMQLRYFLKRDAGSYVEAVSVLRNKMFDSALFEEGGDDHVGKRGLGDVHQSVYRGLMGRRIGEVTVPQSRTSADDGLLSGAVVGDADGCGYARPGEDDGMGRSA